jgi:hypothetical protein
MKAGNGKEKITGELQGAINQLRTDLNKVELWASALTAFSKPVPQYDLDQQRHQLPHALPRAMAGRES